MSIFYSEQQHEPKLFNIIVAVVLFVVFCFTALSFIGPIYNVWQQGLAGQAELKRAEQNRQIAILEAEAQNEAATSVALARVKIAQAEGDADVARAHGAAEANTILGNSLKDNEEYLRYLYITTLATKEHQIIYVPTEAGLPLLEAGKR